MQKLSKVEQRNPKFPRSRVKRLCLIFHPHKNVAPPRSVDRSHGPHDDGDRPAKSKNDIINGVLVFLGEAQRNDYQVIRGLITRANYRMDDSIGRGGKRSAGRLSINRWTRTMIDDELDDDRLQFR